MIGRKRINRKVDTQPGGEVIDLSPGWAFTVTCPHHGPIAFDFNRFRTNDRERLSAQMRDAVWSLRNDLVGRTLHSFISGGLWPFWHFLDDLKVSGQIITCLAEIDEGTIRQFLAWLELQVVAKGKNKGQPWSLVSRKSSYERIKSLLINRQKLAGMEVSRDLKFPKNPFPLSNSLTPPRSPYSDSELGRIIAAINIDLKLLDEQGMDALPPLQVMAAHIFALAVATGRNAQSLLDLKRDSLRAHPLPDREMLITEKRKGYSTHVTAYRKEAVNNEIKTASFTIPTTIGGHVRALRDFTLPLMEDANPADMDFILLYRVARMKRKGQVLRLTLQKFNQVARTFVSRHRLIDDRGARLALNMARLRPTFGSKLYERTRDVRKVQKALGHSDPKTTARHYISLPDDAERNHVFVGQAMVGWATSVEDQHAIRLAADGQMPLADARKLLNGGYNTLIARCKNPFRENGAVCSKYLPCFNCAQMVVFEDDLWRLYSFYYKLIFERVKMNQNDWLKTYGSVIKIIDVEIAPAFDSHVVAAAKRQAQDAPHPAWPRGASDNE